LHRARITFFADAWQKGWCLWHFRRRAKGRKRLVSIRCKTIDTFFN